MCEKHSLLKKDKLIKEPDFEREWMNNLNLN
jgi:hypothetical protein